MTDIACTSLADHLAERRKNGLVDIKFYVHDEGSATPDKVCAEAGRVFDAIKSGSVEVLTITDKGPMPAQA